MIVYHILPAMRQHINKVAIFNGQEAQSFRLRDAWGDIALNGGACDNVEGNRREPLAGHASAPHPITNYIGTKSACMRTSWHPQCSARLGCALPI